jgi:hypothetical protein
MESFERARTERGHYIPPRFIAKALDKYSCELPVTERGYPIDSPISTEPDVQISRAWLFKDVLLFQRFLNILNADRVLKRDSYLEKKVYLNLMSVKGVKKLYINQTM